MFTPIEGILAFSVDTPCADAASDILGSLDLDFERRDGLAKVTLVGAGMHGIPGVMARVAESLSAAGIEMLQSADSHYTISVLVDAKHLRRAVESLHTEFGLGVE
jgi:aspartate kinase